MSIRAVTLFAACVLLFSACSDSSKDHAGGATADQGQQPLQERRETMEQVLVRRGSEAHIFIAENQRKPRSQPLVELCKRLEARGIAFERPDWPYVPYYLNRLIPATRLHGRVWLVFDHRNPDVADVMRRDFLADQKIEYQQEFDEGLLVLVTNEFREPDADLVGLEAITSPGVMTTDMAFTPDDDYVFVVAKTGHVRWFQLDPEGRATGKKGDALRMERAAQGRAGIFYGGESGMIGFALHPAFRDNHRAFTHYNWQNEDGSRLAIVSEWRLDMSKAPGQVVMVDERRLLEIPQEHLNHNAGCLAFGADGCLYIAVGDGEIGEWTKGRSPAATFRGKVLRIDVDHAVEGRAYSIPEDNPFVGDDRFPPETWAWGFRNPWRLVFVPDGRLIASDIGEDVNEELTFVVKGKNHGWPYFEGAHQRNPWTLEGEPQPPLISYGRSHGMSVIAGGVFEGSGVDVVRGRFVFLDYVSGRVWAFDLPDGTDTTLSMDDVQEVARLTLLIPTVGCDHHRRMYFGAHTGQIYRLVEGGGSPATASVGVPADPDVARSLLSTEFPALAAPAGSSDEAAGLGALLFAEKRLSIDAKRSCATCHDPARWGQDGLRVADGGRRNTPTVWNSHRQFAQFRDFRVATVEQAALASLSVHMGRVDPESVIEVLRSAGYEGAFVKAFGEDAQVSLANLSTALGAYLRRLGTSSRWERFLDGDDSVLTEAELIGLNEFLAAGCTTCHMYRGLGGAIPQKLGLMKSWQGPDKGRGAIDSTSGQDYFFKVPTLFNVSKTGPYYHDGSMPTLADAVANMAEIQLGRRLEPGQVAAIVAFLSALDAERPAAFPR